jgi:hypothetical protein
MSLKSSCALPVPKLVPPKYSSNSTWAGIGIGRARHQGDSAVLRQIGARRAREHLLRKRRRGLVEGAGAADQKSGLLPKTRARISGERQRRLQDRTSSAAKVDDVTLPGVSPVRSKKLVGPGFGPCPNPLIRLTTSTVHGVVSPFFESPRKNPSSPNQKFALPEPRHTLCSLSTHPMVRDGSRSSGFVG